MRIYHSKKHNTIAWLLPYKLTRRKAVRICKMQITLTGKCLLMRVAPRDIRTCHELRRRGVYWTNRYTSPFRKFDMVRVSKPDA